MLRKTLTTAAVASAVVLAGCAHNGLPPPVAPGATVPIISPTGNAGIDNAVASVQDVAVRACGFLPTVSTVSSILSQFISGAGPINSVVTEVAQGICSAVTRKGFRRGMGPPKYRGVVIHGTRVR